MAKNTQATATTGRILSVDALRGFDMFWIIGGGELAKALLSISPNPVTNALARQFDHANWAGFRAWDIIMPLFLFIVGTSLPFSMSKRLVSPENRARVYRRIAKRFVILFILGMAAEGNLLYFDISRLHVFCNTLQANAVGYAVAAILIMNVSVAWQAAVCIAVMAGFQIIMSLVPVPGHAAGALDPGLNFALYVDQAVMGRFHDGSSYTWVLSGMTFTATVLMGVMSGHILKSNRTQREKLAFLVLEGAGCTAAGLLMSIWFPIIKHIWSTSFTLFSGGLFFLLLTLFYWIVDVAGRARWAFFFIVVGSNSLLIYMLATVTATYMPASVVNAVLDSPPVVQGPLFAGFFAVEWGILYFLYRKKWFLSV